MIDALVHGFAKIRVLHPVTDYLSHTLLKEKRVIVEGYSSSEPDDSEGHSLYMFIPDDATMLIRKIRKKRGSSLDSDVATLHLVGHFYEKKGEIGVSLEDIYSPLESIPHGATYFYRTAGLVGVRTIIVEDGRVYCRLSLSQNRNMYRNPFTDVLQFAAYKGLDRAFEIAR